MRKRLLTCLVLIVAMTTIGAQETWMRASKKANPVLTEELQQKVLFSKVPGDKVPIRTSTKITLTDNEMVLGYCNEKNKIEGIGTKQPSTFSCASFFPKNLISKFGGSKVKTIRFALFSNNYVTDVSVWICKKLGETKIVEQNVGSVQAGWNDIALTVPCEIDGEGIYVGYTLILTKVVTVEKDGYPIGMDMVTGDKPDGAYLSIGGATWQNYYGAGLGTLMLQVILEGDKFLQNDVSFDDVTYNRSLINKEFEVSGLLTNYGKKAVSSIDVSYELGGITQQANIPLSTPVSQLEKAVFSFKAVAPAADGRYDMNLKIEKVNGVVDEDLKDNEKTTTLICMAESFPRKTVMEEGTGVWCGWCPRGIVGMEKLKEKYPDTFIGIAVHWSSTQIEDPMQVNEYSPIIQVMGGSFPGCIINRSIVSEPYFGNDSQQFGIDKVFDAAQAVLSEASLTLSSAYVDNEKAQVSVTSQVKFGYTSNDTPYKMAYIVVEDGITGASQYNYYNEAFYSQNVGNPAGIPADLERFRYSPSLISNLVFNDVAVGIYNCLGIEGSLEGKMEKNQVKSHTYTINLPARIKNKDNVSIVALLLDATTGEIVNAQQAKIGSSVSIKNTNADMFNAKVNVTDDVLYISTTVNESLTANLYTIDGTLIASETFTGEVIIPASGLKGIHVLRITDGNNVIVKKIVL